MMTDIKVLTFTGKAPRLSQKPAWNGNRADTDSRLALLMLSSEEEAEAKNFKPLSAASD